MNAGAALNEDAPSPVSAVMNPRTLLLPLLFLLTLSAAAQLPRNEATLALGIWDSDELGNDPAIGASYNHYWTGMFSTRAGGFVSRGGDFTTATMHVSAELHLFRAARVSPWVGAGGAWAHTRRAASNDHFVGDESQLTGIYSAGVDYAVSPAFALGAEASYMNYEMTLGNRFGYRVDPVTVLLSGRWRF